MDDDSGVDVGFVNWSGYCVDNFIGFDVDCEYDDVAVAVDVAVGVAVYDGVDVDDVDFDFVEDIFL